ncbi:hypothetical protein VPH35_064305 [Triticum aestivum]
MSACCILPSKQRAPKKTASPDFGRFVSKKKSLWPLNVGLGETGVAWWPTARRHKRQAGHRPCVVVFLLTVTSQPRSSAAAQGSTRGEAATGGLQRHLARNLFDVLPRPTYSPGLSLSLVPWRRHCFTPPSAGHHCRLPPPPAPCHSGATASRSLSHGTQAWWHTGAGRARGSRPWRGTARGRRTPRSGTAGCRKRYGTGHLRVGLCVPSSNHHQQGSNLKGILSGCSTMALRPSPGCPSSAPTGSSTPCSSTTTARRSSSTPAPCRRKSAATLHAAPWRPLGGSGRSSSRRV